MTKLTGSLGVRNEINVDIIGTGARGKDGKSAYEIWLDLGGEGTEQEYLASLTGTSYSIVADRTELTGQVELIAGDNVSLDVDNENKTITVNSLGSDKNYIHNQLVASSVWTIIHNLDKHPSVTVVDSSDSVVVGDISYDSLNQLTVVFSAEFGGKAYVN